MSEPVCVIASSNWNSSPGVPVEKMLGPMKTLIEHLDRSGSRLASLVIIKGEDPNERIYLSEVQRLFPTDSMRVETDTGEPWKVAHYVSQNAAEAAGRGHAVWVDITAGPKPRASLLFAAASVVPGINICYAERTDGEYGIRIIQGLRTYNEWLGQHGLQLRDYAGDIKALARQSHVAGQYDENALATAVGNALAGTGPVAAHSLGPNALLLTFAESISNRVVPATVLGSPPARGFTTRNRGEDFDKTIRALNSERERSACRAAQMVYQLRCLMAHPPQFPATTQREDTLALLDGLAFIGARFRSSNPSHTQSPVGDHVYVAIDGDDVGRRFESLLMNARQYLDLAKVREWSLKVQHELTGMLLDLAARWDAVPVALTGDGFLVLLPQDHLDALKSAFRPCLPGELTVSTGIGPTIRDAYLALKLCKAGNRGGGIYYSMIPPVEDTLWVPLTNTK